MRKNLMIGASMLLSAMMVLTVIPTTQAAPINPSTVWGSVFIDGANQTAAHTVEVWIDGQAYGTNTSWNGGAGTWWVLNMVCDGDDLSYAEKEGGINGDLMTYVMTDVGPRMADNTYAFTSGTTVASIDFAFNTANQPVWGKINEIVNNYQTADYVYLYFPSVPTFANYRIEDNAGNSFQLDNAALGVTSRADIGQPNMYFVNLSAVAYNIPAIGTLKLAWEKTAGVWVPIDRVEFGWTAVTSPGYANTIHNDYAPGVGIVAGNSAIRTTNGTADTGDSSVDFMADVVRPTLPFKQGGLPTQTSQLWVQLDKTNNDNILHWVGDALATEYRVYATNTRSTWSFVTPLATVLAPTTTYTHQESYADSLSWYYIVRSYNAAGENTTVNVGRFGNIAYESEVFMDYDAARQNTMWISVPWRNAGVANARQLIENSLNEGDTLLPNAKMAAKWNIVTQGVTSYQKSGAIWVGTNFALTPGAGYYTTVLRDFTWHVNGTDWGQGPVFFDYDAARQNKAWFSMQFNGDYTTARLLIENSLNGGNTLLPNTKMAAKWNIATQGVVSYQKSGAIWVGTNFAIDVGVGYYTTPIIDFNWANDPLTP